MQEKYSEFSLVLGNGDTCRVRYCDYWGVSLFGRRTIHFEFFGCLSISETQYRSEFRVVGAEEHIDPEKAAKEIVEQLTGIPLSGENVQMKLF